MSEGTTASSAAAAGADGGFPPPPPPPGSGPSIPGGGGPASPTDAGWLGDLGGMARAARGMLSGRLLLLALELRRARHGLVSLLILTVVAAIAGATAWIALWAGLAALAVQFGLSWPWACAAVLGANLLLLLWVVAAMKALTPMLALPASRRQFHWLFNDPMDPEEPTADGRTATPT
ncbi:hypothetical protein CDN99_07585 [Roseateles aquatilis]|uniref:Phage holin family protein n=1 Tax=Roseateles aquatilis TaxID=431061 RepID=A0A246JI53_9BURK|nr:hypothetical protein [Roseateles aquatilis]OWQ92193.1 hypothetical protein CDN99_07585 [Roseateles aquatilis]